MYAPPAPRPRRSRTVFAGVPVIALLVIVSTSAAAAWVHEGCRRQFFDAVFGYPNAQTVSQTSVFLGEQRIVFRTTDAPALVEAWYAQRTAAAMRHAVVSGNFNDLPERYDRTITALADGGTEVNVWTICPD